MPYTLKQCRAFAVMAENGETPPSDWRDKCRGVTDSAPFFVDSKLEICDKSFSRTPEGFLSLQGIISRSGTQTYYDAELGLGTQWKKVEVLRPKDEVVDPMSVASFIGAPVTDDHPDAGRVTADNFKNHMKGVVIDAEATDSGHVKASLIVYDGELIDKIEAGKRELSAGYQAEFEFSDDGKTAIQRKIRGNHVAFVDKARCGAECRILDNQPSSSRCFCGKSRDNNQPKGDTTMAKMKIKGVEYEVADSLAGPVTALIEDNARLIGEVSDQEKQVEDAKAKIEALEDTIRELKEKAVTDEDMLKKAWDVADELVTVMTDAALLVKDYDPAGKSPDAIRRDVVVDKYPDAKEKPQAYIDARFDMMVEQAKAQAKQTALDGFNRMATDNSNVVDAAAARQAKIQRFQKLHYGGE